MSATDLDAPPFRVILMAIIIVVGLHVLTAVALVAIQPPEIKIEPEKVTPPIEIELVTLPVKTAIPEVEEVQEVTPKKAASKIESKPKVAPVVKTKQNAPEKPVVKAKKADIAPVVKVEEKKPDIIKKVLPKKPIVESKVDTSIADSQREAEEKREILAVESRKAAQEAHDRAVQEAKKIADAKADKEARDAQAVADAKAAKAAAQKAAEMDAAKKSAEAAAQAASNQPVSFSGKDAAWITPPNFEGISDKVQTLTLRFTVTKQGNIENININGAKNIKIDREVSRRLKRAKLKPFIQNGTPVVGVVTLSIEVRP